MALPKKGTAAGAQQQVARTHRGHAEQLFKAFKIYVEELAEEFHLDDIRVYVCKLTEKLSPNEEKKLIQEGYNVFIGLKDTERMAEKSEKKRKPIVQISDVMRARIILNRLDQINLVNSIFSKAFHRMGFFEEWSNGKSGAQIAGIRVDNKLVSPNKRGHMDVQLKCSVATKKGRGWDPVLAEVQFLPLDMVNPYFDTHAMYEEQRSILAKAAARFGADPDPDHFDKTIESIRTEAHRTGKFDIGKIDELKAERDAHIKQALTADERERFCDLENQILYSYRRRAILGPLRLATYCPNLETKFDNSIEEERRLRELAARRNVLTKEDPVPA